MNYELNYKITDRLLKMSCPTKRSQRYEQNKSLQTMSRLYDNHFDKDIHGKPWISLGIFKQDKMVKYEHSDAGLSFTNVKIKKLRTFQELWEKNEDIKNKTEEHQGFRYFREFADIEEEDVIVTIEYCTNCNEHLGSTKHDETKYLLYAQTMKNEIINRFPICKVILKPLIYDHLDHSIDTMFLQRRLGCFEVQVYSKQKGQIKQAVIGSKLATKSWPSIPVIINKLPAYFKKISFNIDIKFAASDQKLTNIEVKIQPYRPKAQNRNKNDSHSPHKQISNSQSMFLQSQERSNHHLQRPQSTNYTRPKSAYSTISVQSQRTAKQNQENTNVHGGNLGNPSNGEDTYKIEKTNEEGRITLKNVPLDVYEIIIEETNDFLCKNQTMDLFKLADVNQPLDQIIQLQKQTHSCVCVTVTADYAAISEAKVEIIPQISGGKEAILKESPLGSGKYEIVVEPCKFKLFIKKIGYYVLEDLISTKSGVCEYKYQLKKCANEGDGFDPVADALDKKLSIKPSNDLKIKKPKFLFPPSGEVQKIDLIQFQFIDLITKQPVHQVYIKVFDEINNKLYSYRSNELGICKALLDNKILKGRIIIQHNEYYHETKEINDLNPLQINRTNTYHIIHKPAQSQLIVLIVNQAKSKFINFYIIQENRKIIQTDLDIKQQQNEQDGIQYVKFENLNNKKDILQLVACLPSLKSIDSALEFFVLTPNAIYNYPIPQKPQEQSQSPYFWVLGSLKEPYETFDVVNSIIYSSELKTYPNLIKTMQDQPVMKCAFQSPNLIVAANQNKSISIWNLDSYMIDTVIPNVLTDTVIKIVVWDDENVAILDISGAISWLKKDEISQQFQLSYQLPLNRKATCMSKVGTESISIGCEDGSLVLVSVKLDVSSIQLNIDSILEGTEEITSIIAITNDSIAVLYDVEKKIVVFKVEKSLDKPLSAVVLKSVPIKGYSSGGKPILQILSLEQRYLIFGGYAGILHTISIDNLERGPNFSFNSDNNVNSVLQTEDGVLIMQEDCVTFIHLPDSLADMKQQNQIYFQSPVKLYNGDCQSYEKRLITYSDNGRMLIWSLQNMEFPKLSEFLDEKEFPQQLRPVDSVFILVEAKLGKENLSLQLVQENGEIIKESSELVKFQDFREDGYFYLEIHTNMQKGLWRINAHMHNTELIKQQQPKIYFISNNGYQIIHFPTSLPLSKKQTYNWLVGTMIPKIDSFKTTSFYTDISIVGKFPSLESSKHQGKINQLVILNKDEFITAGEDKQIIIWDANTFKINKTLYHDAEILSIFVHNGMILAGNKDGCVMGWKQHDGIWLQDHKFKYHEKGVYAITYVDGSIVTSSEDRKIQLVNYITGALEHAEPVDRTFVISLQAYSKDQFAAGFPDGRVKTYKREKSGPKIILKTLRTTVSVKCQHITLITNQLLFVGGMDKISDIVNVDTGIKFKTLKEGHQGAILCSIPYLKYVITGGSDGRLNIWNIEKAISLKTYELTKEEIRGIIIVNELLITASSNGVIRIWQEICPFIKQIPIEEEIDPQAIQQ